MTKLKVFNDGRFIAETKDWHSYWQSVYELGHEKVAESLNLLYLAWRDHILSGFGPIQRRSFCHRYFSLLDTLISLRTELTAQAWLHALQSILGFECFGIAPTTDDKVLAADTSTLRNPCYLLAKLKMPDMLNTPRFLPVITLSDIEQPELFYHYRQHSLSSDSFMSLLLYPAVTQTKRSASFKLLNKLACNIRYAIDPWTSERAEQIFEGIIRFIIQCNKEESHNNLRLEFVDIGAGSGSLTSRLCQHILKMGSSMGFHPEFRIWSVDLEPTDPSRFFRTNNLRVFVDSLTYIGDDYRNWLSQPQNLPTTNGIRIALISKIFDVFSHFSIEFLSSKELLFCLPKLLNSARENSYDPAICLAAGGNGENGLITTNSRLALQKGNASAQASLSKFYRGLSLPSMPINSVQSDMAGLFLPVRTFNPKCLTTEDGKSVISQLSKTCSYIIIEDADLRPQDLIDHATKFSLSCLTIWNLTKALKLKGNYLYVIWPRKVMNPSLSGEQIW